MAQPIGTTAQPPVVQTAMIDTSPANGSRSTFEDNSSSTVTISEADPVRLQEARRPKFLNEIEQNITTIEHTLAWHEGSVHEGFYSILTDDILILRDLWIEQHLPKESPDWIKLDDLQDRLKKAMGRKIPALSTRENPQQSIERRSTTTTTLHTDAPHIPEATPIGERSVMSPAAAPDIVQETHDSPASNTRIVELPAGATAEKVEAETTTTTTVGSNDDHADTSYEDKDDDSAEGEVTFDSAVYPKELENEQRGQLEPLAQQVRHLSLEASEDRGSPVTAREDQDTAGASNASPNGSSINTSDEESPTSDVSTDDAQGRQEVEMAPTDAGIVPLTLDAAANAMAPATATHEQKAPLLLFLQGYETLIANLPRMQLSRAVHAKTRKKRFFALIHALERNQDPDLQTLRVSSFWRKELPSYALIWAWGVRNISSHKPKLLERALRAMQRLSPQQQTILYAALTQSRVVHRKNTPTFNTLKNKTWDVLMEKVTPESSESRMPSSIDAFEDGFKQCLPHELDQPENRVVEPLIQ